MGLDIPDCSPKCPTSGMTVIRMTDFMFMIDQTKVPIAKLHIMDIPNMPGIVADQGHITGIRHNHRKILSVD